MKSEAVSALRSKRGLRPGKEDAEPPVVGLTPQTTNERRANTMKTYILRDPKTVEPHFCHHGPRQRVHNLGLPSRGGLGTAVRGSEKLILGHRTRRRWERNPNQAGVPVPRIRKRKLKLSVTENFYLLTARA